MNASGGATCQNLQGRAAVRTCDASQPDKRSRTCKQVKSRHYPRLLRNTAMTNRQRRKHPAEIRVPSNQKHVLHDPILPLFTLGPFLEGSAKFASLTRSSPHALVRSLRRPLVARSSAWLLALEQTPSGTRTFSSAHPPIFRSRMRQASVFAPVVPSTGV